MAKTNTGGNTSNGGNSSSGGNSGSGGSGYNDINEPLTVNTEGLRKAAQNYLAVGDNFHNFAVSHEHLLSYAPLKGGESDETWDKFSPKYVKGTKNFLEGVHNLAALTRAVSNGVVRMAEGHEATEENAVDIGSRALPRDTPMTPGTDPRKR